MHPSSDLAWAARGLRLKNLCSSAAVVAVACGIYVAAPYNHPQIDPVWGWPGFSFTGAEFLFHTAAWYVACLALFYLFENKPGPSKSLMFIRVAARFVRAPLATLRRPLSGEDRLAVLVTLLKAFFAPMMTMSLMLFSVKGITHGYGLLEDRAGIGGWIALFDRHGFWFLMQVILFVDVLIFTFGYVVELPRLQNEIRSVDPTLLGWIVAMACYPPFNVVTGKILGTPVSDFPRFDDPMIHIGLNLTLLALMAAYASASVALGWKASNLTHRGVVASGPYAVIRHPAYTCKNMAWWIGAIPLVALEFSTSAFAGLQAAASMVAWSMIYVLRALTEEDHLRSVDGEYAAYAARVRYRFLPGIY